MRIVIDMPPKGLLIENHIIQNVNLHTHVAKEPFNVPYLAHFTPSMIPAFTDFPALFA